MFISSSPTKDTKNRVTMVHRSCTYEDVAPPVHERSLLPVTQSHPRDIIGGTGRIPPTNTGNAMLYSLVKHFLPEILDSQKLLVGTNNSSTNSYRAVNAIRRIIVSLYCASCPQPPRHFQRRGRGNDCYVLNFQQAMAVFERSICTYEHNLKQRDELSATNVPKTTTSSFVHPSFFVVFEGKQPGIYLALERAAAQLDGFDGGKYSTFTNVLEAESAFYRFFENEGMWVACLALVINWIMSNNITLFCPCSDY
jgi:hypothetical protein